MMEFAIPMILATDDNFFRGFAQGLK